MTVKGRQRAAKGEWPLILATALVLFLVVGIGLLPLTGRTISGSRGWINFRVDPGAGPGRGIEFTRMSNAYDTPGATFYEFRVGSWYWAAFVAPK
jgi:hypothetical protein